MKKFLSVSTLMFFVIFGFTNLTPANNFADQATVEKIHAQHPLGEGTIAFAEMKFDNDSMVNAFLLLDEKGDIQYILETVSHSRIDQYLLPETASYLGVIRNSGYILFFGEYLTIGQVQEERGGIRIFQVPEEFRHHPTPTLTPNPREQTRYTTYFYEALEESNTVVGLYTWNGRLYLLAKEAMGYDGSTTWWLIRLNPHDGEELARVQLPTKAAHIELDFGPKELVILQKGEVQGVGDLHAPYFQELEPVRISTKRLENALQP